MTPAIDFARKLIKTIDSEVDSWKSSIAAGRCASFDQYRYSVGIIVGFENTRQLVLDQLGEEGRQALGLSK